MSSPGPAQPGGVTPDQVQGAIDQQAGGPPPPTAVMPCSNVLTWIEVRLLDFEGNPVGGKQYRIKLPGGAIKAGVLGRSGSVRLDGIEPGTCGIAFPEIDADAWERI